jgi:hypothetical protein
MNPRLSASRPATLAGSTRRIRLSASALAALAALTALVTAAALAPAAALAGSFPLYGPQAYVRRAGPPAVQTAAFALPVPSAPYTLRIDHLHGRGEEGGGEIRAIVTLNGQVVLRPADFKGHRREIDRAVQLLRQNQLSVQLLGDRGTGFTLSILGVDTVAPTLSAKVAPGINAAGWNRTPVTVTFFCADRQSGIASCSPPVTVSKEGAGQTVTGTAVDRAGNQASFSVTLNIDETPPTAAFTSPGAGTVTNATPALTGTFADALSGIDPATLAVLLDGVNVTAAAHLTAGGFTVTPATPLAGGAHQASFTVADRAGNTAQATVQFSTGSDNVPPAIAITAPNQTTLYNDPAPVLAVAYSDTGSGVDPATFRVTLDGAAGAASCTAAAATATCTLPVLAAGVHEVTASVSDRAGNQASAKLVFNLVLDTTPPTVTFVAPTEGSFLSHALLGGIPGQAETAAPAITVQLADADSGVDPASVRLLVDGADVTAQAQVSATSVLYTPPSPFADGPHAAEADASDLAGNRAKAVVQFIAASQPPTVTIVAPTPGGAEVPIDVTYAAGPAEVDKSGVLILLDGHDVTSTCTVTSAEATCPAATGGGHHELLVEVVDRAGNGATATVEFGAPLDATPPTLAITGPAALVSGNPTPAVTLVYSDTGSGVDVTSLQVTVDGADDSAQCTAGPSSASCATPPLARGPHTVAARLRDRAGNVATASSSFLLVLPVPVAFTSPVPGLVTNVPAVQVTGTVSPRAISVVVNGVPATLDNGAFAIATLGLHEGTNNLVAVATDAAGNIGTATIRVTADVSPPIVSITSPQAGDTVATPAVTVTGLVNDLTLGTVNETQATVTVNGVAATVANRGWVATGVALVPGSNTLTAVATDQAGNQTTARLQVQFAPAAGAPSLQAVAGDAQAGPISTALPNPLVVQALDVNGAPLAGKQVIFKVVQGNGQLAGGKRSLLAATDAQGMASTPWTLGSRAGAGVNRVRATAVGIGNEVTFTGLATAGTPAAIDVAAGDNQRGLVASEVSDLLEVVVTDQGHNPVANATVAFQVVKGGGGFGGAALLQATTDGSGLATARLTLGPAPGLDNNLVQASVPGAATARPVTLKASAFLPADPAQTGIKGVVLDNQGNAVPGVTIRLRGSALTTVSDVQGKFFLTGVPVGQVFLIADASTAALPGSWASLEYELFALPGVQNALPKPVYILPLDLAHGIPVDETHGGTVKIPGIPGFALDVAPGSVVFPDGTRNGTISVTAVHADKIPMPPGAGMQPRLIVTIQPAGARFNPPAAMTLPNLDGLAPGTVTELFSFDHSLGAFVSVGTGTVSDDGMVVRSDPGFGVLQAGWHCGAPPVGNGDNACLDVTIANDEPILLDAPDPQANAAPRPGGRARSRPFDATSPPPVEADGTPAADSVYALTVSDSTVVTIDPMGDGLCPNAASCTTTPTVVAAGDVMFMAQLTSQTTGQSASTQKPGIAGNVQVKEVISEQQPGSECNKLPPPAMPGSNNPMLVGAANGTQTKISVRVQITPDSAVPYMRIGVRRKSDTTLLDNQPAQQGPAKTQLSFPASSGLNLYEVVAWLDRNKNGKLDADEVPKVFPSQFVVVTASDWSSAHFWAESKKLSLSVLSFFSDFDSVFLGDKPAPSEAQVGSGPVAASVLHHPLGALWDGGCNSSIPQFTFQPASQLSLAVGRSDPMQNLAAATIQQHAAEIEAQFGQGPPNSITYVPPVPWQMTGSLTNGISSWGSSRGLGLVYGNVGRVTINVTKVAVLRTSSASTGTQYRVYSADFNGNFQDYFNYNYYDNRTTAEGTVEVGYSTISTPASAGAVFSSVVNFGYSGNVGINLQ